MLEIKWKGKKFLLVGTIETGGAIATRKQYKIGATSTAHLTRHGHILQFGYIIGSKKDIEVLGEVLGVIKEDPGSHEKVLKRKAEILKERKAYMERNPKKRR